MFRFGVTFRTDGFAAFGLGLFGRSRGLPPGARTSGGAPPGGRPFVAPPGPSIPGVTPVGNPFGIPGIFGPNTLPGKPDVVFKRGVTFGAGRLFGIGGLVITAAELLIDQLERQQEREIQRRMDDADEAAADKIRRKREVEIFSIPRSAFPRQAFPNTDRPDPDPFEEQPPIRRLEPVFLPQRAPAEPVPDFDIVFPPTTPGIGTEPVTDPRPRPLPERVTKPGPPIIPFPAPVTSPVATPLPGPGGFETENPFGLPNPAPLISPIDTSIFIGDLLPDPTTGPLTGVGPGSVGLPGVNPIGGVSPTGQPGMAFNPMPMPSPAGAGTNQCPATRCDDDLDEPRFECFKGLYREGLLETDFTAWTEIDCITGREL